MEERPVEVVKKAIETVARNDFVRAASLASAALNEIYVEEGILFRVEIMNSVFENKGLTKKDVNDVFVRLLGCPNS